MQLNQDHYQGKYLISSCTDDTVTINGEIYTHNIFVGKELLLNIPPTPLAQTTLIDWQALLERNPEIILVGTKQPLHTVAPRLQQLFYPQQIGFEIMTLAATCRTLSILLAEERRAFAALFFV